jgi:hypothetical protein
MPREFCFRNELSFSQKQSVVDAVGRILVDAFSGVADVVPSKVWDDRRGVDFWVERNGAPRLRVDCKIRRKDWQRYGRDDIALEIWSDVERGVVGWTGDTAKHADFILWIWLDTGRWELIPFAPLQRAFRRHGRRWSSDEQNVARQRTTENGRTWESECVFVPREMLWSDIRNETSGCIGPVVVNEEAA